MFALTAKRAHCFIIGLLKTAWLHPVPHTTQRKGRVFYRLLTQNWWYRRRTLKKDDTGAVQVLHQDCLTLGGSSTLGTWQGQVALAQGYAEADWGPQLAKKYLHDEAKITKRLAREMETAAQICQIAVLDHQN